MDTNPDETRIFSMISGKTQEESKELIEKNREFAGKIIDLMMYLRVVSKDNADLIARLTTIISTFLQPFPVEMRAALLSQVALLSLGGKSDDLMDTIKRCSIK